MAQALIRNIDDELLEDYREAAKLHDRSLESELRDALRRARPLTPRRRRKVLERLSELRAAVGDAVPQTPSETLVREIRDGGA